MIISEQLSTNYLPQLTGIRAIAAFMVFFHHFNPFDKNGSYPLLHNLLNEFHVGVSIFFVLSGFLICFRYSDSIGFNRRWLKVYLINRFARIYPLFFIITLGSFVFDQYQGKFLNNNNEILTQFLINVLLLKGFFKELLFSGIDQGWSLTVEECFYLSAPLILYFFSKWIMRLVIPIVILSVGFILVYFSKDNHFYGFFADNKFMLSYTFFGRCVEFLIGIQLAIIVKKGLPQFNSKYFITLFSVVLIFLCIGALVLVKGELKYGIKHPVGIFVNNFILPFFVASLFLGLIKEKSIFSRILSTNLFQNLGKSSYAFYLIHYGFIFTIFAGFINVDSSFSILIMFLLLIFLSYLLYVFLEEPLNKRIKMLLKK